MPDLNAATGDDVILESGILDKLIVDFGGVLHLVEVISFLDFYGEYRRRSSCYDLSATDPVIAREWDFTKNEGSPATDERPEIASSRLEVGHWEGDTVVGKRNGKEAVILTLLEKKTQHYLAIRIPGKTGEAVNAAMQKLREDFGASFFNQIFKTITVDNGSEFANFAQIDQFGTKVYFAHPYTSWERAQNERENGMLRRYVPKGVSIENFSDEEILWAADALNGLPRRNLGYCTPEELFEAFLDIVYAA